MSVAFTLGSPDAGWGLVAALVLQAGVLVAALRIAVAPLRVRRVGRVAALAVVVTAVALEAAPGVLVGRGRLLSVFGTVLVLAAMAAIVVRLGRRGGIDGRTVLGAICVYLLLGTLFTFAFGAVAGDAGFFAGDEPTTLSSLQFFSFVTLTTVGYGDLVPLTRVGRSLAVVEALVGQVYLVTVVALLVGRLGTAPLSRSDGPDD